MCDPYETLSYRIDETFKHLECKWYPEVLLELTRGASRYSEQERALLRISPRTLSVRLSELKEKGIISLGKRDKNNISYELTEKGKELIELLNSIAHFSIRWYRSNYGLILHVD